MKNLRPAAAVPLISPSGIRVPVSELTGPERSGPSLAGVRDPIGGNPAAGLTPARLAAILRGAADGDWLEYLELAEAMEERDPHYRAVLGVRKRSVAQLPVNVEAASDDPRHEEHADLIRRWLKRGTLRKSLFDVLDAAGKGFSVHEIIWDSKPSHVWPGRMHYRPQRWFEADRIDRDTPRLRQMGYQEDLPPHRYFLHIHKDKSGSVIRSGIAYAAAWGWMMKRFTEQLVPWIISLNFGPQEDYPVVSIGRPDEMPIKDWVQAIKDLAPLGLKVETGQIYDRLGIEEPGEDAETIGGVKQIDPLAGLFAQGNPISDAHLPEPYRHTLERMSAKPADKDLEKALLAMTAREAGPALADLKDEIRSAFDQATSLEDLKDRLDVLKLDPKAFAAAMGRSIALGHLAGRAALMDDLRRDDEEG